MQELDLHPATRLAEQAPVNPREIGFVSAAVPKTCRHDKRLPLHAAA